MELKITDVLRQVMGKKRSQTAPSDVPSQSKRPRLVDEPADQTRSEQTLVLQTVVTDKEGEDEEERRAAERRTKGRQEDRLVLPPQVPTRPRAASEGSKVRIPKLPDLGPLGLGETHPLRRVDEVVKEHGLLLQKSVTCYHQLVSLTKFQISSLQKRDEQLNQLTDKLKVSEESAASLTEQLNHARAECDALLRDKEVHEATFKKLSDSFDEVQDNFIKSQEEWKAKESWYKVFVEDSKAKAVEEFRASKAFYGLMLQAAAPQLEAGIDLCLAAAKKVFPSLDTEAVLKALAAEGGEPSTPVIPTPLVIPVIDVEAGEGTSDPPLVRSRGAVSEPVDYQAVASGEPSRPPNNEGPNSSPSSEG